MQDGNTNGSNIPGAMLFRTTSATNGEVERICIRSSGNVGIGTTNPQKKLDVHGGDFNLVHTSNPAITVGTDASCSLS